MKFGAGLSGYSRFALACALSASSDPGAVLIGCNVTHTQGPAGDEVLMVFHRPGADVVELVNGTHPLPLLALRNFTRLSLPVGGVQGFTFELAVNKSLAYVNEAGASVVYAGTHLLDVFNGNTNNVTVAIDVAETQVIRTPPQPW